MLTTQLEKDGAKYPRPPSANFLEEDLPAEPWRRAAAATEEDRKITVSGLTLDF